MIPLKFIRKASLLCIAAGMTVVSVHAQSRTLTLEQAITMALSNSHVLKMNKAKVDLAISKYNQAKDMVLPAGSASATFSHAEIPANHINLGSLDWTLPKRADSYNGGASLTETIFDGFKLKYAQQSTLLLAEIAKKQVSLDEEEVIYTTVQMYFNLYKIARSQQIVQQNAISIDSLIRQAEQFYQHGIVTKNDVLRFRLQKSATAIMASDLAANRSIVCYNMAVLLGLPEDSDFQPEATPLKNETASLEQYLDMAFSERKELQQNGLQSRVDQLSYKTVKAAVLPKLSANAGVKYIHAGSAFIPESGSFISPFSAGATLSWSFSHLWTNKNKLSETKIQQQQTTIARDIWTDKIKTEVNQAYRIYLQALNKVNLLQSAIEEATENDRMQADRYKNNVTTVTERVDADTKLYQALTDMEIACADTQLAWYRLLKAAGKISAIHQ
nr:TolC family protein [uncultured Chitinophaga sp.]